jgi:hypothetical protein
LASFIRERRWAAPIHGMRHPSRRGPIATTTASQRPVHTVPRAASARQSLPQGADQQQSAVKDRVSAMGLTVTEESQVYQAG